MRTVDRLRERIRSAVGACPPASTSVVVGDKHLAGQHDPSTGERGGALLELAIALPLFFALLALIFDAGLGFGAARESTSAAQAGARVAAQAANDRLADFRVIDLVQAEYAGSGDSVVAVTVFRGTPGGQPEVPVGCGPTDAGVTGLCNVYRAEQLATTADAFADPDCEGDPDMNWCPTTRVPGEYVGVGVWVTHSPTVGLLNADETELSGIAVYPLFIQEAGAPEVVVADVSSTGGGATNDAAPEPSPGWWTPVETPTPCIDDCTSGGGDGGTSDPTGGSETETASETETGVTSDSGSGIPLPTQVGSGTLATAISEPTVSQRFVGTATKGDVSTTGEVTTKGAVPAVEVGDGYRVRVVETPRAVAEVSLSTGELSVAPLTAD